MALRKDRRCPAGAQKTHSEKVPGGEKDLGRDSPERRPSEMQRKGGGGIHASQGPGMARTFLTSPDSPWPRLG